MAVRDALLALLTAGPAYGFQLHGGLATRTGGRRMVNVGQTYATIERLTKQQLVEPAGTTPDGLPLHRLTPAGERAASAWLSGTDAAGADPWDETVDRVLIAWSLPGRDAAAVVAAERERWTVRHAAASDACTTSVSGETGSRQHAEDELARLAASAALHLADAAIAWLDSLTAIERLAFAPGAERPKRGRRPARPAPDPHDGIVAQPADA